MTDPVCTVYVIPGSHACRSAMLMLDHKRLPYRRVDFVTFMHPMQARLHGFDAGGQTRTAGTRRPPALRLGDLLGTVPGLACDGQRISTNYRIARFLEERKPDPPLFPADPERRAAVEEAERWANEKLQMEARRVLGSTMVGDRSTWVSSTADGRLGPLLFRQAAARRIVPTVLRQTFAFSPGNADAILGELPEMLDRIDGWIAAGVIGGAELNVADCMIAPSLALMLYRRDLVSVFEGRPALELVDRLLPEPATA